MDYWKQLHVVYYESFEEFYKLNSDKRIYLSTTKATKFYTEVSYSKGDFIMFGRESSGVTDEIRRLFRDTMIKIPMINTTERSLNLSNSVAIIAYEALRQIGFEDMK